MTALKLEGQKGKRIMNAAQIRSSAFRIRVLLPLAGLIAIGALVWYRQLSHASYVTPSFEIGGVVRIVVVDEQDNRVEGAWIVPHGLRALQDPASAYSWNAEEHGEREFYETGKDGVAQVEYPKWTSRSSGTLTSTIMLYISHPQFCSQWSIECPVAEASKVQPVHRVKLIRGGQIRMKGRRSNPDEPLGSVYAHVSSGEFTKVWQNAGDSKISPVYAPGPHVVRIIDQSDPENLQFSDAIHVDLVAGQTVDVDVVTRPGISFRGKLNTPLPVTNGFVTVTIVDLVSPSATRHDECNCWRTWTTVNENGEFELQSLPPSSSVTLHAWCDGYVNKGPDLASIPSYATTAPPQSLPLFIDVQPAGSVHLIPMEACAQCEVTVADTNGNPLEGIEVSLNPNVLVGVGGMTLFGFSTRMEARHPREYVSHEEQIKNQMEEAFRFGPNSRDKNTLWPVFGGKTDALGKCRIDNLPIQDNQTLWISHPDWIAKDQVRPPFRSTIRLDLKSGELTKLDVQLIPKPALTAKMLTAPQSPAAPSPPTILQRAIANLRQLFGI